MLPLYQKFSYYSTKGDKEVFLFKNVKTQKVIFFRKRPFKNYEKF